jgi:hypothetical protein
MSASAPRGNVTGASDPAGAVRGFMAAVDQQDLQAMGAFWGGPDGPARDLWPQDELYKRELVIICYTRHDHYDLVGEAPAVSGGRSMAVTLTYKGLTRSTTAEVVRASNGRWYLKDIDVTKLGDICAKKA